MLRGFRLWYLLHAHAHLWVIYPCALSFSIWVNTLLNVWDICVFNYHTWRTKTYWKIRHYSRTYWVKWSSIRFPSFAPCVCFPQSSASHDAYSCDGVSLVLRIERNSLWMQSILKGIVWLAYTALPLNGSDLSASACFSLQTSTKLKASLPKFVKKLYCFVSG